MVVGDVTMWKQIGSKLELVVFLSARVVDEKEVVQDAAVVDVAVHRLLAIDAHQATCRIDVQVAVVVWCRQQTLELLVHPNANAQPRKEQCLLNVAALHVAEIAIANCGELIAPTTIDVTLVDLLNTFLVDLD